MGKKLRVAVPAFQVLSIALIVAWSNLCHDPRIVVNYFGPTRDLLLKENFPLVVVLAPIAYALDRVGEVIGPVGGTSQAIGTAFFGLLLFIGAALFWYLVVVEVQMRVRGESLLRFR